LVISQINNDIQILLLRIFVLHRGVINNHR